MTLATILVLVGALCGVVIGGGTRDCYVGEPPFCNNSLSSDLNCRGIEVSTADGWKRMDCDYALYNVPAQKRTTGKWLVVHAGECDTFSELLGDYFAPAMQLNIFGLRPCGGYQDSKCAEGQGYDICAALHASWFMPRLGDPVVLPYGLGFNPPALVDIFHTPGTTMLFLHEFGDTKASYNWYPADGCNATKPVYMCVGGIDPDYANKFRALKALLEAEIGMSESFGNCKLEVIDATPYAQDADPEIPCTGILREYNNPSLVGGVAGSPNWAWEMTPYMIRSIVLATQVDPEGAYVQAFTKAIDIALCTSFSDPDQTTCHDPDDTAASASRNSSNLPASSISYPKKKKTEEKRHKKGQAGRGKTRF